MMWKYRLALNLILLAQETSYSWIKTRRKEKEFLVANIVKGIELKMGESQQSGFGKLRVDEREINDGVGKGWGDK